jgi:hypothetical protein
VSIYWSCIVGLLVSILQHYGTFGTLFVKPATHPKVYQIYPSKYAYFQETAELYVQTPVLLTVCYLQPKLKNQFDCLEHMVMA